MMIRLEFSALDGSLMFEFGRWMCPRRNLSPMGSSGGLWLSPSFSDLAFGCIAYLYFVGSVVSPYFLLGMIFRSGSDLVGLMALWPLMGFVINIISVSCLSFNYIGLLSFL